MRLFIMLAAVGLTAIAGQTAASERLENALMAHCEKVKTCARQGMAEEDMTGVPPDMLAMINQQLEMMCEGMRANYDGIESSPNYTPELDAAAAACLESNTRLSCDALESSRETPECQRLDAMTAGM